MKHGLAAPTVAPPAASVRPSGRTGCAPPRNDCAWSLAMAGHHARPARMASRALLLVRWASARGGGRPVVFFKKNLFRFLKTRSDAIWHYCIDQIRTLALIPLLGNRGGSGSCLPVFLGVTFLATRAWLRPVSRGNRHFTVGGGRLRQSGPRPEMISLRSACTRRLKDFIANGFSSKSWPEQVRRTAVAAA
ncbi:hypothetical protein F511_18045 [Dorcoceras hygrometricum]|uniref:Uncharacterized protein n=1 Tax=Dorcoceras hygrometricum TaxID=472368 RepID=A0A2Z7D0R9_9LAMI|nr:hypothetical protein F511_18045 [Dorcoceras hygrometricum]